MVVDFLDPKKSNPGGFVYSVDTHCVRIVEWYAKNFNSVNFFVVVIVCKLYGSRLEAIKNAVVWVYRGKNMMRYEKYALERRVLVG